MIVNPTRCEIGPDDGDNCPNLAIATIHIPDVGRLYICTECLDRQTDHSTLQIGCSPADIGDARAIEAFARKLQTLGPRPTTPEGTT
jgi:hypothetical protein